MSLCYLIGAIRNTLHNWMTRLKRKWLHLNVINNIMVCSWRMYWLGRSRFSVYISTNYILVWLNDENWNLTFEGPKNGTLSLKTPEKLGSSNNGSCSKEIIYYRRPEPELGPDYVFLSMQSLPGLTETPLILSF